MTVTRGQIVDYTVTDSDTSVVSGSVSKGEVVPLLVVSVSEDGDSYTGFAFLPNGVSEFVTYSPPPPAAVPPKYDSQTGVLLIDETPKFDAQTGELLSSETPKFDPQSGAPVDSTTTGTATAVPSDPSSSPVGA